MDYFVFLSEKKTSLLKFLPSAMPGGTVSPVNGKVVICATAKYSRVGVGPYTCYG
jgi:hypothetical protein